MTNAWGNSWGASASNQTIVLALGSANIETRDARATGTAPTLATTTNNGRALRVPAAASSRNTARGVS